METTVVTGATPEELERLVIDNEQLDWLWKLIFTQRSNTHAKSNTDSVE